MSIQAPADSAGTLHRLSRSIQDMGLEGYQQPVSRRLRQVNWLNAFLIVSYLSFAVLYALMDFGALWPLSVAIVASVPFFLVTPFLHRLGDMAGAIYIAFVAGCSFLVFASIVGSAAGMQYWLLAAGGMIVFFGTRRVVFGAVIVCCLAAVFLVAEFLLPASTEMAPISAQQAACIKTIAVFGSSLMIAGFVYLSLLAAETAEAALEREYARSEHLLLNLMPTSIASRLKARPDEIIADHFDEVTILFADIVDFTPRASRLAPSEIVAFLNRVFSTYDELAESHGLEKIKTIGDAYMVAGGLPDHRIGHSAAVAEMALGMIEATRILAAEFGEELHVRIGIHTGPAVAGVIGTRKLFYDVWGDTVNTASRMESLGSAGKIQVTQEAKAALGDDYAFVERGLVTVKGKGELRLSYLVGRRPEA